MPVFKTGSFNRSDTHPYISLFMLLKFFCYCIGIFSLLSVTILFFCFFLYLFKKQRKGFPNLTKKAKPFLFVSWKGYSCLQILFLKGHKAGVSVRYCVSLPRHKVFLTKMVFLFPLFQRFSSGKPSENLPCLFRRKRNKRLLFYQVKQKKTCVPSCLYGTG